MELTALQQFEQYMSTQKAGHSELGLRKKEQYMTPRASSLKKVKLVQGSSALYIYPLELRLPFNPKDVDDETFNIETPFILPFSVHDSISGLKTMAQADPVLHAKLAELAKVSVEEYDLTDPTEITENDKKALWRFRNVIVYSSQIQEFKMSGFGKYGRKGLSTAQFDEYGQPVKKDLGYMLYELEVALANSKIAQIEADYAPGGPKANLSSEEKQKERKAVWEGLKVKAPKPAGVMRVITVPCRPNWSLKLEENQGTSDVLDNLRDFEGYVGGSYDAVKEVESMIGTGYDKHVNYLEVAIHYPTGKGKTDGEKALNSYNNREFTKNPLNTINDLLPGFNESYNAFRSDTEVFNEETMLKSVFEFRPVADDLLIEHYKADLGDKVHLINSGIAEKYHELIERIDSALSEELMMNVMSGITSEGQANLSAPADDQKEYVIDNMNEEEESSSTPVEDLISGTDLK